MKTRKLIVAILIFVAFIVLFAFISTSNAASGLGYLKITRERTAVENYVPNFTNTTAPYTVIYKHQLYTGNNNYTKNIWKIVSSTKAGQITDEIPDLYCLRAGLGFTNENGGADTSDPVLYDQEFNMTEDYEKIKKYLSDLNSEVTIFEDKDNFNAVLWILDNMLLEDMGSDKIQEYLLKYAGYEEEDFVINPLSILSEADIEAIQQLAIWYFTNPELPSQEDQGKGYYGYHSENLSPLYVMLNNNEEDFYNTYDTVIVHNPDGTQTINKNYKYVAYSDPLHNFNTELDSHANQLTYGIDRQEAAKRLYSSLINGAKAAAAKVKTDTTNTDKLYETKNREVTVYLAPASTAAVQQPVVQVREKEADIALRKFISEINDEKLENSREPEVDTSNFNKLVGSTFKTTAIYNHPKKPVSVEAEDIVTYTIRLYNEGEVPAYIKEVTDYLPKWLQIDLTDTRGYWKVANESDPTVIVTTPYCEIVNAGGLLNFEEIKKAAQKDPSSIYLANIQIPAAKRNENATSDKDSYILSYVDIEIKCKVKKETPSEIPQTNIAEVTKMTADLEGKILLKDRDSQTGNVIIPTNEVNPEETDYRPEYTGGDNKQKLYYDESNVINSSKGNKYYPGQQDDDDFDKVVISYFDLALRKFITAVGTEEVNNRIPEVSYKDGKITYNHRKDPVGVATGDIVTYTIRVFNEGKTAGYANEITDDLPEGLEFLPDNSINKRYGWKMLDEDEEETTDVKKAKYIVTDYLSEEQEGKTDRDNKLEAFNPDENLSDTNPDYRDVKVAFKVTYVPTTKEEADRIIVNVAQISDDSDDDIDSDPNRDEKYDPNGKNEDDIDYDNVIVKYFDLALLKWVSQTKITLNGETVITDTGHTAETSKNEQPVLISIKEKDIDKVIIKYIYTIRVMNQGELEGYATEIKDHIPEGLEFFEEDNKEWGWKEISGGIVTTDYLKDTLLLPKEQNYAEVKIVLTWINDKENFGEKVNLAEISKDKNKGDVPDIDSTPDNLTPQGPIEDDEDDAPVILAMQTGAAHIYIGLMGLVLTIFAIRSWTN